MNISKKRDRSFLFITLIYTLATAVGVFAYLFLPYEVWQRLLIADIAATIVIFAFSVMLCNASVYDPYWSVQPVVIIAAFSIGETLTLPRLLLIIAIVFWGVRLTANWAYTFHGLDNQDWRYTMLQEQTSFAYPLINFFGIHMVPTLVVYACVMPAVLVMRSDVQANAGSVIFFMLCITATIWQGVADYQMHRFRRTKTGGFIRSGLWKYSRHPNYLGEILMWWGIGLSALSVMPNQWLLLSGAVINTCLFLFVSIPLADKHQSRKEGFAEYRQATHALLPFPKTVKTPLILDCDDSTVKNTLI